MICENSENFYNGFSGITILAIDKDLKEIGWFQTIYWHEKDKNKIKGELVLLQGQELPAKFDLLLDLVDVEDRRAKRFVKNVKILRPRPLPLQETLEFTADKITPWNLKKNKCGSSIAW